MAPENCHKKITYRKDLKCCTYEPFIPNFSIGAILSMPDKYFFANQVIQNRIQKRKYALPVGMVAPVRYQIEYNKRKSYEFGNREDWLCSFYNKSEERCSIWSYRGHVCTSFYCKSSYGKVGLNFWKTLENYLSYIEMALMEEALVYLDFSPRQVTENLSYIKRDYGTQLELRQWSIPKNKSEKIWNFYYDSQKEFYIKTYKFVDSMSLKYFSEALGDLGKRLYFEVQKAAQRLEI